MGSADASAEDDLRRELALRRAVEHSMRAGIAAVDVGCVGEGSTFEIALPIVEHAR